MSENQSEDIIKRRRSAIRGAGLTLELAAEKLGIGRNTLYAQLDKAVLDEQFIHNVRTKLNIELSELKGGIATPPPSQTFDQYLYQQVMTTKDQVINAERSASQTKDHVIKLQSDVAALRQEMNANFLTLISQVSQVSHSQVGYMNFLAEQFAAIRDKDPKAVKKELDKLIASGGGV